MDESTGLKTSGVSASQGSNRCPSARIQIKTIIYVTYATNMKPLKPPVGLMPSATTVHQLCFFGVTGATISPYGAEGGEGLGGGACRVPRIVLHQGRDMTPSSWLYARLKRFRPASRRARPAVLKGLPAVGGVRAQSDAPRSAAAQTHLTPPNLPLSRTGSENRRAPLARPLRNCRSCPAERAREAPAADEMDQDSSGIDHFLSPGEAGETMVGPLQSNLDSKAHP